MGTKITLKIQNEYHFEDFPILKNESNCILNLSKLKSEILKHKIVDQIKIKVLQVTKSNYFFKSDSVCFSVYADAVILNYNDVEQF
jgi:hypothetical protein